MKKVLHRSVYIHTSRARFKDIPKKVPSILISLCKRLAFPTRKKLGMIPQALHESQCHLRSVSL